MPGQEKMVSVRIAPVMSIGEREAEDRPSVAPWALRQRREGQGTRQRPRPLGARRQDVFLAEAT